VTDSEAFMRGKLVIYCEMCGGDTLSCTTDFITFHHLSFCSPDCRDAYRTADEERRAMKEQPAGSSRTPKAA
jgi:hypothetical protein